MAVKKHSAPSFRDRLIVRLSNPLEYSFADKTILLASITSVVVLFGWLTMHGLHTYVYPDGVVPSDHDHHTEESHRDSLPSAEEEQQPSHQEEESIPAGHMVNKEGRHDLHAEGLFFIEASFLIIFGLELVIIALALWLRRSQPEGRFLPYFYAVITSASIVYIYDLAGHSNNLATLLILFAQLLFGLLLFDRAFVLIVFCTWIGLTGFVHFGEKMGLIPHLVDLLASHEAQEEFLPIIRISIQAFSWLLTAILFMVTVYIISRWRSREAQVVEYSAILKKMFGQYLSAQVMNSLLENPATLRLGGERRRVTIMMADLRGFSSLAERLKPEQVVDVVNSFCEVMIEVILEYGGTIIEIMGDALLVVFGAPEEMKDRAERAIACALAMQKAMDEVNFRNQEGGLPRLEMGIGLNDSDVIVGNIGSAKRAKYGVVGPGVNMASRIESFTVGGQVLISESLYRKVGHLLRIDGQKQFQPKGSEQAVIVYEVGGIAGKYNMAIEGHEHRLLDLSQDIPLSYSVISGKRVDSDQKSCRLVRLGKGAGEVIMDQSIESMTNLRLNLTEVDTFLTDKKFYAKVIKQTDDDRQRHLIRFTSLPPEVDAFLQAVRKLGIVPPES